MRLAVLEELSPTRASPGVARCRGSAAADDLPSLIGNRAMGRLLAQAGVAQAGRQQVQRGRGKGKKPPPTPPAPRLPQKVIVGTTELSRVAEAYRVDHGASLPAGTNLLVVEYSVGKNGAREREVISNRSSVAHSEAQMDQFVSDLRKRVRTPVTVHQIYSERQPCGPSDHDCESMLLRRYPTAKVTFGWGYQETQTPGPESRAARARARIEAHQQRLTASKQLEWVFENDPPPHHERNDPGPISKGPRRWKGRLFWSGRAGKTATGPKAPAPSSQPAGQGPSGREVAGQEAALAAGQLIGFVLAQLMGNPFDEKNQQDLVKGIAALEPEVVRRQDALAPSVLALQRRGEIANLNVTYKVVYLPGRFSRLSKVELESVEVSEWFKSGLKKLKRPYDMQEGAGNSWTEKPVDSWSLALRPEFLAETAQHLYKQVESVERQMADTSAEAKDLGALKTEHRHLVKCIEMLGTRGRELATLDSLGGSCTGRLNDSSARRRAVPH